ncbi:unnamed protein product, partial [Mesorhabditis belari]|uniref:G-protein coupled receptors family 1 profile domain-containing protein n=1 Tax=Mesorhabditis belari TaxID=2138241 RepID=A0AAF3J620_9BILA
MATTAVNFSHICLTEKQMMVHGTELEYNLQRYIYPAIATFGIMGNALNLTVLLNRSMRSRANSFLAVLAFADIIFLSLVLPNVFANYGIFVFNYYFRWIYLTTKIHLIAMANWSSAVAIWCIISVCADRLWGIRNPLYARDSWPRWKMPVMIISIVSITGILTFYQHFEQFCPVREYCNRTQVYSRCQSSTGDKLFGRPNPHSIEWRNFISFCVMMYPMMMIIFPIILLVVLNMMLICALRRRQRNLLMGGHCSDTRRSAEASNFSKTEHRVTLTVTFIVTMFTITNGPSALEYIVRKAYSLQQHEYYDATVICTTLVIFGKASNFILFCLGSKHFRLRLIKLTQKKVNKKIENFSTTFLDRPSFRRNSVPSLTKHSSLLSDSNNNGSSDLEKKRSHSKPSLGVKSAPNPDQLRQLNGRSNSMAPLARMERFAHYDNNSSELHQPLIHNNSGSNTDELH